MIKILEEVAVQRQQKYDKNTTIQLSTTFMRKTVDSVNNWAGKEIVVFNDYMTEFKLMLFNTEYLIRNRAYRDDTNDEDVEEVVLKFICL
jgi:DNA helicase HerA-like ATPase